MKSNKEKALESFRSGMNCAQAAFLAYSDALKVNEKLALMISAGFGGGMGRLQETCGTVTGSYMVMGVFNSQKLTDRQQIKNQTYSMIQSFHQQFKAIHGSTHCKDLLNCDLKTEEGQKVFNEQALSQKVCEKCLLDAIRLVEELTNEN